MKRYYSPFAILLCIAVCAVSTSTAQTNTIFLPKEIETRFGNSLAEPFGSQVTLFQQVYGQSAFVELPTDTIIITKLAFRVDESNASGTDVVSPGILLRMNIFHGTLDQIVEGKSALQAPIVTIFSEQDVHITGRADQVDAFDVEFLLENPFAYDRRLGPLVLLFGSASIFLPLDVYSGQAAPGIYLYTEAFPEGQTFVQAATVVTKISYRLPPKFEEIRRIGDAVNIEFKYSGTLANIKLERSAVVSGPFLQVQNVEFLPQSAELARAIVPFSSENHFYRIRQSLP